MTWSAVASEVLLSVMVVVHSTLPSSHILTPRDPWTASPGTRHARGRPSTLGGTDRPVAYTDHDKLIVLQAVHSCSSTFEDNRQFNLDSFDFNTSITRHFQQETDFKIRMPASKSMLLRNVLVVASPFVSAILVAVFMYSVSIRDDIRSPPSELIANNGVTSGQAGLDLTHMTADDRRALVEGLREAGLGGGFPNHRCNFSVVYNKPPKTASTYIQSRVDSWSKQSRRNLYRCSNHAVDTSTRLRECVPRGDDGCGVVNGHIWLSPPVMRLLEQRLPNTLLVTSTRYVPHRIVSHFLQKKKITNSALVLRDGQERLERFLVEEYNMWGHYNYHFGTVRSGGSCPLSLDMRNQIYDDMSRYDVVVDVNLPTESNKILDHFGLFSLDVGGGERLNERGTEMSAVGQRARELLRNVSCVEIEMHKALQQRMASLYEMVSKKSCIRSGVVDKLSSCLAPLEKAALGSEWLF